jgi:hypothetical protein
MPTSCVTFEYLPIDQHLMYNTLMYNTQLNDRLPSQILVIRRLELMLLSIMGQNDTPAKMC